MSALIDHEHSGSSTIVDTNMSRVGNNNVTKSRNIAVKQCSGALAVPINVQNACNKKADNWFLNSRCGNDRGTSFGTKVTEPGGCVARVPWLVRHQREKTRRRRIPAMGRKRSATRCNHLQILCRRGLRGTFAISTRTRADPGKMVLERSETWKVAARVRCGFFNWSRQRTHQPGQ